jgi:nickel-dependent lactate racemase
MTNYTFLYGNQKVQIEFKDGVSPDLVSYREDAPFGHAELIKDALANPLGSPPLQVLAQKKRNAVIIISDATRLSPSYLFLEHIISELNAAGIVDANIAVVVALGLHRKQTKNEIRTLVGEHVMRRVPVYNHSALSEDCVYLGTTSMGTPIEINRMVVEADIRIATGNIEPHRMVGMSGGIKAIIPGVASEKCIVQHHSLSQKFVIQPGIVENPMHQDLAEALNFLPVHFLFNTVVNHRKEIIAAVSGDIVQAHRIAVEKAKAIFMIPVSKRYDTVIVSCGGHPKDTQVYQAVKTLQNASDITKTGGSILLIAECAEIYGNGILQYWVETITDRTAMVNKLKEGFVLGAHKIEHMDKVFNKQRVYLYSNIPADIVELLGFHPVFDLQQTADDLCSNGQEVAVMPYGSLTFLK